MNNENQLHKLSQWKLQNYNFFFKEFVVTLGFINVAVYSDLVMAKVN